MYNLKKISILLSRFSPYIDEIGWIGLIWLRIGTSRGLL
jgi:hypothetical protein